MGVRRTANMASYPAKKKKSEERNNELHKIIRSQGARIEELKQEHKDEISDVNFKWACALLIVAVFSFCCGALMYI